MSQQAITTEPVRIPHRTIVIAVGLFAVVAIGSRGRCRGRPAHIRRIGASRAAVRSAATAPAPVRLCGHDVTNLLATIAAMPPSVQAQVVGTLSPDLATGWAPRTQRRAQPAPTGARQHDLGRILTRVSREDRNTIVNRLPDEQGAAVVASWKSANVREYLSSTATPCS